MENLTDTALVQNRIGGATQFKARSQTSSRDTGSFQRASNTTYALFVKHRQFFGRLLALYVGSTFVGISVELLVKANSGLSPFDILASGISQNLGYSLGQASWLVAGLLFLVSSSFGRKPSPWGVAYIGACGFMVDRFNDTLTAPDSTLTIIAFVAAAVALMACGITIVTSNGISGGPIELLILVGTDYGFRIKTVRWVIDVFLLASGIVLGGVYGPATILYALLMGPTLSAACKAADKHKQDREVRKTTSTGKQTFYSTSFKRSRGAYARIPKLARRSKY